MESKNTADELPPNRTLHCSNLDDKVHYNEMKSLLFELFIPFGEIVNVHVKQTATLRGQAWVSFKDISAATVAMRKLNGNEFVGRPINVNYAKETTKIVQLAENAQKKK
ncbi:putative U2 small nuclear ribonucleoprotein B-like protein [Gregarina niphandrodes]|uniref:U2 small nuclear ribonucleoprotein B-like protein n=1 Tax=Gregarina niphandrodes TaxID=110365 RepID=A0A023B6R7_GRENI|nr:putative U2 small nuclear ribonucleoprotein B-like protein [Gregarina niphandrodes]EZG66679.1 putative U2 small nuclear ribonucleoprotein B-like protein [Gregarina niphandrodes]|eukprot:XP_011130530.1 putative U2 small nuclear ribonucleoprotein B-like protein [Gregarina niphandrodes]